MKELCMIKDNEVVIVLKNEFDNKSSKWLFYTESELPEVLPEYIKINKPEMNKLIKDNPKRWAVTNLQSNDELKVEIAKLIVKGKWREKYEL